jgi:gliding motility-associated-like protein
VGLPNPVIGGQADVCQFTTTSYQVNPIPGSSYQWAISGGVFTGNVTNATSVNATWNTSGNGSVTLIETNSYGCSKSYVMPIDIKQRPIPAINGNRKACVNNNLVTYFSPLIANTNYIWSVQGGNIISVNGSNSINVLWANSGLNTIVLQVVNTLTGCDSTMLFTVEVSSLSSPIVTASQLSGCPPLTVNFSGNLPGAGQTYEWTFGDQYYSTSSNPTHVYETPGTFQVKLVSRNESGCADTVYGSVEVYDKPLASFTHNYENSNYIIGESNLVITNNSKGGNRFMWTFGTADTALIFEPQYTYYKPGDYIIELHAINDLGCRDLTFGLVRVKTKEHIYVPNAFSPNSDNINDYFSVESENIAHMKVMIFNRWGDIYYSSTDKDFKWDGTYRGDPVELGIYGYMIKAKGENGGDYEINGTLTLVR